MTCPFVNPASGYRTLSRLVSLRVRSSILTSTSVLLATFAHHLPCRLVRAQALERRRAQLPGLRPFHELELSHELGLDEVGALGRRATIKRARLALQRVQQRLQLLEHLAGKPGAALARINKVTLLVVADQQRAGVTPPLALAFEPASDHQF